jgi:hypothetical protein
MQFMKRVQGWYFVTLAVLLGASGASAAVDVVDFTVDPGKWVHDSFPPGWPFGLPPNPTLTGQVTIDTSLTGSAAFVALDYVTGTKTWTLADLEYTGGYNSTYYADSSGNLVGFTLYLLGPTSAPNVVAAGALNNTVDVNDGVSIIDCLQCVTTNVPTIPGAGTGTGVPEPSVWALLITGFGLLGLAQRRRFGLNGSDALAQYWARAAFPESRRTRRSIGQARVWTAF